MRRSQGASTDSRYYMPLLSTLQPSRGFVEANWTSVKTPGRCEKRIVIDPKWASERIEPTQANVSSVQLGALINARAEPMRSRYKKNAGIEMGMVKRLVARNGDTSTGDQIR
jgi:hypothetical protein